MKIFKTQDDESEVTHLYNVTLLSTGDNFIGILLIQDKTSGRKFRLVYSCCFRRHFHTTLEKFENAAVLLRLRSTVHNNPSEKQLYFYG